MIEDLSDPIKSFVPDGYKCEELRWPLDPRQKDPAMADMLQIIRHA